MNPTRPRRRPRRARGTTHKGKCATGKARFATPGDAWSAALRVSRHLGPVRAYPCPTCSGWHLTRRRFWKD